MQKQLLELQKSLCNGAKEANVAGGLLSNILYVSMIRKGGAEVASVNKAGPVDCLILPHY